jgi:UDP-N-acetylglucosamine 2-epimerase (non-hydrolysing)
MKINPLIKEFNKDKDFETFLVHTGQHYDYEMSKIFFDELDIPCPNINLEVGSSSHASQTAEIIKKFEPVFLDYKPDYVIVVGDVNSTIACGLVVAKTNVKLCHVEAGLRSFDRTMPEEINRILTDHISDLLFVSEESGVRNLSNENIYYPKVHFVGDVMIDNLLTNMEKIDNSEILEKLDLSTNRYGVFTLHRPSNVDFKDKLQEILNALEEIQGEIPIVFPIHPRTLKNLKEMNLLDKIEHMLCTILIDPLGYIEFIKLIKNAKFIITDSGCIQEETTFLNIPCLTLRENTERPITIEKGTNKLVSSKKEDIIKHYNMIKSEKNEKTSCNITFWDGRSCKRIVKIIKNDYKKLESD